MTEKKTEFDMAEKKTELDIKAHKLATKFTFLAGFGFIIGCPFLFIWTFFGGIAAAIIGCILLYTAKELSQES